MSELPTGTVTLLFSDIEGSTRLLQRAGGAWHALLEAHERLLRSVFEQHGGVEVSTAGDAFFVAFALADDAVAAAAHAQRALAAESWPAETRIQVRIGIHTGEPQVVGRDYAGLDVHRAARVMAAGHGGQVLISQATRHRLRREIDLVDLGEHRLKDLLQPEHLYQLRLQGLPDEFPPLKTIGSRPTNLPMLPTPLIGRVQELHAIAELLTGSARAVTLTGPGGTGKTRLALQAAAELLEQFSGGVFFVALASIREPELVVPAIARTFALREAPGEPLVETVAEYLRDKELLVVLDNFEHVVEAAEQLSAILAAAPAVRMLATSRERLQLSAERVLEVEPLPLPTSDELEVVARNDAATLFVARATALEPGFALTRENAGPIREICTRLDGLPLAIELAAARLNVLTPDSLLARLEPRLPLLTGGARDLPERQRTLAAVISWSYDLLTEEERATFARLAVFVGGSAVDAAEEVCDADLETIASLLDKNLVRRRDDRIQMLETIREFALERLDASAEAEPVRLRHAEHYVALAENAGARLRGSEEGKWLAKLEREHDNLRASLTWADTAGRPDLLLRLCAALRGFWYMHHHVREGTGWLDVALRRSAGQHSLLRAHVLQGAANFAGLQGQLDRARDLTAQALALYRDLGDRQGTAFLLRDSGVAAARMGDFAAATTLYEESAALFRELGDDAALAIVISNLGDLAMREGEFARAQRLCRESASLQRELGATFGMVVSLNNLAFAALHEGRIEEARVALEESLLLAYDLGAAESVGYALEGLAAVAAATGESNLAGRMLGRAEAIRESTGIVLETTEQALHERTVVALRNAGSESELAAAMAEGASLQDEDAVALALAVRPDGRQRHR